MASYTCPHCHKNVKDLAGHIKRVHPDQTGEGTGNGSDPAGETGAEALTLTAPAGADASQYHCVDCGKPVDKGRTPCPHCGAGLDWSAVQ